MRGPATAALATLLVLTACADDGAPDDGPTELFPSASESAADADGSEPEAEPSPADPTPSASETADTAPAESIDVTTTPDVITLEWTEAVINTLLAINGEVLAEVLSLPVVDDVALLPEDLVPTLEAVFHGRSEAAYLSDLDAIARDEDFIREQLLPAAQYDGIRVNLVSLLEASPECVVAVGRIDRSRAIPDGGLSRRLSAWSLSAQTATKRGDTPNPTEWVLIDELANRDAAGQDRPDADMLEAVVEDFGSALQNTCDTSQ